MPPNDVDAYHLYEVEMDVTVRVVALLRGPDERTAMVMAVDAVGETPHLEAFDRGDPARVNGHFRPGQTVVYCFPQVRDGRAVFARRFGSGESA